MLGSVWVKGNINFGLVVKKIPNFDIIIISNLVVIKVALTINSGDYLILLFRINQRPIGLGKTSYYQLYVDAAIGGDIELDFPLRI